MHFVGNGKGPSTLRSDSISALVYGFQVPGGVGILRMFDDLCGGELADGRPLIRQFRSTSNASGVKLLFVSHTWLRLQMQWTSERAGACGRCCVRSAAGGGKGGGEQQGSADTHSHAHDTVRTARRRARLLSWSSRRIRAVELWCLGGLVCWRNGGMAQPQRKGWLRARRGRATADCCSKAFREPTLMFTRNEQAVSGRVVGGYQRAACPARPSAGELVLPRAPPGGPAQKALPSEPVACVPGSAVAFVLRGRASS